jgi:hypothetical protein
LAQDRRMYGRLAVSILVASLVIAAAIFASTFLAASRTVTEIVASTSSTTGTSQLYQLEFSQESNCFYGDWFVPWAVVLNGAMVVQPSNATVSPYTDGTGPGTGFGRTSDGNLSTIWFSLPNGTYSYKILPRYALGSEQSGNVTIDGSNVVVRVLAFIEAEGCSSTRTSS